MNRTVLPALTKVDDVLGSIVCQAHCPEVEPLQFNEGFPSSSVIADTILQLGSSAMEPKVIIQLLELATSVLGLSHRPQNHDELIQAYAQSWSPQRAFDICGTNRYKSVKDQAAIRAHTEISAGAWVDGLNGIIVSIDSDQDQLLIDTRRDFSTFNMPPSEDSMVIVGPVRFINHSCLPNACWIRTGDTLKVRARKEASIKAGEEITILYDRRFFGKDCLCPKCGLKKRKMGGSEEEDKD